jgi:cytochrome b561|tara:strand:+ start:1836 stop:2432 length:597 start_codon:yes stop_codon:yes gene_type:complete
MALMNSQVSYGSVAKWLHWLMAFCFLGAYCAVYYGIWFIDLRSPDRQFVRGIHTMLGLSVGLLVLPRLIWRIVNPEPHPDPAPNWQHLAAKYAHWGLYFFMIASPLTGWLGTGGRSVNMFWLFEIPTFRGSDLFPWLVEGKLGLTFEQWEHPIDIMHKKIFGKWMVWMLILVHVAAALYHHFKVKDKTLKRMWPGGKV